MTRSITKPNDIIVPLRLFATHIIVSYTSQCLLVTSLCNSCISDLATWNHGICGVSRLLLPGIEEQDIITASFVCLDLQAYLHVSFVPSRVFELV